MRKYLLSSAILMSACLLCCVPKVAAQVALGPVPKSQFLNQNGTPMVGGIVCTYAAGTNTPLSTYTDSTGTIPNTNPVILDSAGRANIWFTSAAYKIKLAASGSCSSPVNLQWTVDGFSIGVFASANNSFIGNNTFSGTTTFNGPIVANAGGTLSGTFGGNPTFSGNVTISGTVTVVGTIVGTIQTDSIQGTLTNGGTFEFVGSNGYPGNDGETINIQPGAGGVGTATGGGTIVRGGSGGSTGGAGGTISLLSGGAQSGNSAGGSIIMMPGNGTGAGLGGYIIGTAGTGGTTAANGGDVQWTGGTGGTGGNGGNIVLTTGTAGVGGKTGSYILGGSGRTVYSVSATAVRPTCSSTGLDTDGTCSLENYSTDTDGVVNLTAGATPDDSGTLTLTFNQSMGANGSVCMFMLKTGSNAWENLGTIFGEASSSATATAKWYNNSVDLTTANILSIVYHCVGKQ